MAGTCKLFIGGELRESQSTEWLDVTNPATDEGIAHLPLATKDEVNDAVANAQEALSAKERVPRSIEDGVNTSARLVRDGRGDKVEEFPHGYFVGPTIFDNVHPDMGIAKDEIFGPVLNVLRVRDLDEAIEMTNASPLGNSASIYTTSGGAAREFRKHIEAGMLGVNLGVPAPMAFFPFSGWKGSFFGDLHAQGRDGIEFYTRRKVVTSRWT